MYATTLLVTAALSAFALGSPTFHSRVSRDPQPMGICDKGDLPVTCDKACWTVDGFRGAENVDGWTIFLRLGSEEESLQLSCRLKEPAKAVPGVLLQRTFCHTLPHKGAEHELVPGVEVRARFDQQQRLVIALQQYEVVNGESTNKIQRQGEQTLSVQDIEKTRPNGLCQFSVAMKSTITQSKKPT